MTVAASTQPRAAVAPLNRERQAFEFTPWGPRPLGGSGQAAAGDTVHGAVVQVAAPQVLQVRPASAPPTGPPKPSKNAFDPSVPLTGAALLKVAKARIKVIDGILKSVTALQRERAQLSALVLAASPKPTTRRKAPEGIQ